VRRVLLDDHDTRIVAEASAVVHPDDSGDLRLDAGRVWLRVHRSAEGTPRPGVPLCVRTPHVRACVHGTAFEVAVLAAGTTVTVAEGAVRVERPGLAALVVPAGHRIAPPYTRVEHAAPAAIVAVAEALGLDAVALAPTPEAVAAVGLPAVPPTPGIPPSCPPATPGAPPQPGRGSPPARPTHLGAQTATDAGPDAANDAGATPATPDLEALYRAAERALAEGRSAEALELLERIAGVASGTIVGGQALIDIGQTHLRAGRPAEARRAFVRYLAEQPTGAMRELARMSICRIEAGAGRFAEAATCYSTYLAEFPAGAFVDEARRATGQGTPSGESRTEP
jgi:hypothetical protein